jgi:hypothetical protein
LEILAQTTQFQIAGPSHQKVARRKVERICTAAPDGEIPPHVERGGDLLITIEPGLGVVAYGAPTGGSHPFPGEIGCELPKPAGFGHTIAIEKGDYFPSSLSDGSVARERLSPVALVHEQASTVTRNDPRHCFRVEGPVVDHDHLDFPSRILQSRESAQAVVQVVGSIACGDDHRDRGRYLGITLFTPDLQYPAATKILAEDEGSLFGEPEIGSNIGDG